MIPAIPPRSKLYPLEPIGLGTPYVESLTGYISRLAEAHCISVYSFFRYILAELIKKPYISYGRAAVLMGMNFESINGLGIRAAEIIHAVETLTLRDDLKYITLLPWSSVLVGNGLLAQVRRWCPCCYKEWRARGKAVYEPLIWVFREVQYCSRHKRFLSSQCPFCKRTQPLLAPRSRPGCCSRCKMWLGEVTSLPPICAEELQEGVDLEYQKWCVENVGDLLATAPRLLTKQSREKCAQSLTYCVRRNCANDKISLADFLSISPEQISRWRRGKVQPQLSTLLRICRHSDVKLVDYLLGKLICDSPAEQIGQKGPRKYHTKADWKLVANKLRRMIRAKRLPPSLKKIGEKLEVNVTTLRFNLPNLCNEIVARRESYQKNRHMEIEAKLESIIKTKECPSPSVRQVAKRVRFDEMALVKKFPAQCEMISTRFLEYCEALKIERRRQLEEEVRQIALSLHGQGIRPSFPKVGERLSVPSRMSGEDARTVLRSVQEELGYR